MGDPDPTASQDPMAQVALGGHVDVGPAGSSLSEVALARELFWQNVMRQILTSLSIKSLQADQHQAEPMFDGRLAVMTRTGDRIGIASVHPVFACGISAGGATARALSMAVECSVFQIRTPGGEVFTLPLHELRAFHALTPELMRELEAAAQAEQQGEEGKPFGFAAFTSLSREQGGAASSGEPRAK